MNNKEKPLNILGDLDSILKVSVPKDKEEEKTDDKSE